MIATAMKSLEAMNEVAMKIEGEGKWMRDIPHAIWDSNPIAKVSYH